MLRLDFTHEDLGLPQMAATTRRQSISGVQEKTLLSRKGRRFVPVESGGDYILTPAYDLLNTGIHFPNEPTATGLDFFADGHFSSRYELLGFYSSADFVELGRCFGVDESEVRESIDRLVTAREKVDAAIESSLLSHEAKTLYQSKFHDRLRALTQ